MDSRYNVKFDETRGDSSGMRVEEGAKIHHHEQRELRCNVCVKILLPI